MKVHIHHYVHCETCETDAPEKPPAWAVALIEAVKRIEEGLRKMANNFDALEAEVFRNTQVVESAKTLLDGILAQIAALNLSDADDQAKIDALKDNLAAATDALAAAVAANTPAAPPADPVAP